MATSRERLTYYSGIMWHTVLLPDGTRVVRALRMDGRPLEGATTRYYRKPAGSTVEVPQSAGTAVREPQPDRRTQPSRCVPSSEKLVTYARS